MPKDIRTGVMYFRLPDNLDRRGSAILQIPSRWGWVDGYLAAPASLCVPSLALENTGYRISNSVRPIEIVGRCIREPEPRRLEPRHIGLMVEGKLPGFVELEMAGNGNLSLSSVTELIAEFVRRGYIGWLSFYSGDHDNKRYSNPARCDIKLHEFEPNGLDPFETASKLPPRVRLEWYQQYGGTREMVERIARELREIGLIQYEPQLSLSV